MEFARHCTGLADDDLAVVARLLVSPVARRRGIGRLLLETATQMARNLELCPILDVAVKYEAAIRLYEDTGWRCLGRVGFPMPDGTTVDEYVYLAPIAEDPEGAPPGRAAAP
jgi:GNAT superfamily N-acetyltransferase